MSRLFLFGIGGTGARVVRAFTLLAAAGAKSEMTPEVIPIIIDPDISNGDRLRTIELLGIYQDLIQSLSEENEYKGFFQTKIQSLGRLMLSLGEKEHDEIGFDLKFTGSGSIKFHEFIDFSGLSAENRELRDYLKTLFTENNLGISLEKGFLGNPNVGVMVLSQLQESEAFKAFAGILRSGDRIFIVSSIFGGTGAAGFPLLVNAMRNYPNNLAGAQAMRSVRIGASCLLPYYDLNTNEQSAIQSKTFYTKTKAALGFYESNMSKLVDVMYYIGDDKTANYENYEGGEEQKNNAHFIEMLAATSVYHFMNLDEKKVQTKKFYEFALSEVSDESKSLSLKQMGDSFRNDFGIYLTSFAYFLNVVSSKFYEKSGNQWIKVNNIENGFFNSTDFSDLSKVLLFYREWLKEMGNNVRSFRPFDLTTKVENMDSLVVDYEMSSNGFFGRFSEHISDDMLHVKMNSIKNLKSKYSLGKFLELVNKSAIEIITSKKIFLRS